MNRDRFTKEEVAAALIATKGLMTLTARRLSVSAQTIYNYLAKYPELYEVRSEARCEMVDAAELALESAVLAQQGWAVCFTLKTLGRDRGYIERLQVDVKQLDSDIDRELAKLASRGEGTSTGEAESETVN